MECSELEALGIVRHAQTSVEAALEAAAAAAEGLDTHHTSASQQDAACRITGLGNRTLVPVATAPANALYCHKRSIFQHGMLSCMVGATARLSWSLLSGVPGCYNLI